MVAANDDVNRETTCLGTSGTVTVCRTVDPHECPQSIYFGGCAFGSAFYIGVHRAMVERWGPDFWQRTVLGGGSAGTIFAIGIALGKDVAYLDGLYRRIADKSHEHGAIYHGSIYTLKYVREMIEEDPLSYKRLEGRCCFGTTEFFARHRWHLSWESNEDLLECIKGSLHIPFYCHRIQPLRGVEVRVVLLYRFPSFPCIPGPIM